MTRRPSLLAAEEKASPALARALRTSEQELTQARARLAEAEAQIERMARDLAALVLRPAVQPPPTPAADETSRELEALRAQTATLRAELDAVKASTSWKVTAPLRAATGLVRR